MPYIFDGFEWDEGNTGHLDERHHLNPYDVEGVFFNQPLEYALGNVNGEKRWLAIGPTDEGMFLDVIFTVRDRKIRVVTAYEASPEHKAKYRKVRGI